MAAADLVEYVAKSLVDDVDAVHVEVVNAEDGTIIETGIEGLHNDGLPPVAPRTHVADLVRQPGEQRKRGGGNGRSAGCDERQSNASPRR